MKSLIVYYSFEGTTEKIAQKIAEISGGDLLKLDTKKEVTSKKGFGKYFWGGMKVMMKKTPELKEYKVNLNDYDKIFIGTPVWAFTMTPPLRSFLIKENIKNKEVAVFYSHEGAPGKTFSKIQELAPENNYVGEIDFLSPIEMDKVEVKLVAWMKEMK